MLHRSIFVRDLPLIPVLIQLFLCGLDANTSQSLDDQTQHMIVRATLMKNFNGGILPIKPTNQNFAKGSSSNQQMMITSEKAGTINQSGYDEHLLQDAGAISNAELISKLLERMNDTAIDHVKPGIRAMRYGRRSLN